MAESNASKHGPKSPATVSSSADKRSRRDSLNSVSVSSPVDREQFSHALDKIHIAASQSDVMTAFNDFGPPPAGAPADESKGSTGDLVQQGLSGLYSRIKEAVGVAGKPAAQGTDEGDNHDAATTRSSNSGNKGMAASLPRGESGATNATFTSAISSDAPMTATTSSGVITADSHSQILHSSKASSVTTMTTSKSTASSAVHPPKIAKATASTVLDPAIAAVSVGAFKEPSRAAMSRTEETEGHRTGRASISRPSDGPQPTHMSASSSLQDVADPRAGMAHDRSGTTKRSKREDSLSVDGSSDVGVGSARLTPISTANTQAAELRLPSHDSGLSPREAMRKPAVIDRIARSVPAVDRRSKSSSTERGTAEPSPINTSAHNSVHHESFAHDELPKQLKSGMMRIPGTTTNEGAPDMVNARLELMRKQVLSKEFWMADEICKECFLCGDQFSAFRRKHHCRTCGCIFDSKCTSTISGDKFGVPGNLRVCKTCLDIINRRYDSGSEESADEPYLPAILRSRTTKTPAAATRSRADEEMSMAERPENPSGGRTVATPMMAIPATRRIGDPSNRHSAILEIDAPQLSRPSSSRSLKSLTSGRPQSSGHKRHHSRHNYHGRFRSPAEDRAPFRNTLSDEIGTKSKLPAFHDDNIIDPDLAPYMSEESSGDEEMSIFATMASSDIMPSSLDPEKTNFGPFLSAGRRHRMRPGDKSISGLSFTSRGAPNDGNGPSGSTLGHPRPPRRRNLSTTSASQHHLHSPRPKSVIFKGPTLSTEALAVFDSSSALESTKLTRSTAIKDEKPLSQRLSASSLKHVKLLYRQLLQDAEIPNPSAWERALIPILVKCSDDVDPDARNGDAMDVRHYVKLKKIPGGKPGDTSYVSGVIFTKNLALKSMPRSIAGPRVVIISFPIEYQRQQQQHFMSLQPVIEQEKEYLRMVANRIINLRPQVLLAEKSVAGVALQYLAEANIAVVYNVKPSVIEAVSRCTGSDIMTSLDMLALPKDIGQVGGFEVKTFANSDFPGRKKTYIFISGCDSKLGCTIALRGASTEVLRRMKRITEFMAYVVYNLKLESCLMRDEFIRIPDELEDLPTPPKAQETTNEGITSAAACGAVEVNSLAALGPEESEAASRRGEEGSGEDALPEVKDGVDETGSPDPAKKKQISLHESHAHTGNENQVPEDIPAPTFYSDMVAKYETKILSASPFVKFPQPYLLMKSREQERRLVYLKRLRDQDIIEEQGEKEKAEPQRFQLIKPEMVHEIGQKAPRQIMEVLHAVHDAEYDKAWYNYVTQSKQWENYIQGNLDLFDPYSHQNIVVLYSVVCTDTKIPCTEPGLVAIGFYEERPDVHGTMVADCTLGQFVEDLCESADQVCFSNGCDRQMWQHHRTYVHDEARITFFVERDSPMPVDVEADEDKMANDIFMWNYCKVCKKDLGVIAMSHSTWKYSFGKYLELSFWCRGLQMHGAECPHDHQKDHIRYFHYRGSTVRVHYDPIDLLEIVGPRARVTWRVELDLQLKNETFIKSRDRWVRFMSSVKTRIKSIRIDSVLPEKAELCKAEVERLTKKAQDDQPLLVKRLQEAYMGSKYYEIIPLNAVIREMLERVTEWDTAFAKFEADFLSDKDVRQLTLIQLRKMFTDNESKESLATASTATDGTSIASFGSESDDKTTPPTTQNSITEIDEKVEEASVGSPLEAATGSVADAAADDPNCDEQKEKLLDEASAALERVEPLDLATAPGSPTLPKSVIHPRDITLQTPKPPNRQGPGPTPASSASDAIEAVGPASPSLPEKVEQLRKQYHSSYADKPATNLGPDNGQEMSSRAVQDRATSRRTGLNVSPPMTRATSHPVGGGLPRTQSSFVKQGLGRETKPLSTKDGKMFETTGATEAQAATAESPVKTEKKFTDRIGLGALKNHRKAGQSSIPRYVHKKKESKVSSLARHFEQLSREFERERVRDRKQRAAKMHHSRAFLPRSSTKATVEVYNDVDQAVQESGPADDDHVIERDREDKDAGTGPAVEEAADRPEEPSSFPDKDVIPSTEAPSQVDEAATEAETDDQRHNDSAAASDDDAGSDADQSLEDMLPDVETIAEHLEPGGEVPQDLQKDKKSNLMKMLTNFWAERSASSWPQLDYPLKATDHIFIDSDVIVREDEPSSLIAFALGSEDYMAKLADIRHQWKMSAQREGSTEADEAKSGASDSAGFTPNEAELQQGLLRSTGTHLKYQFTEGSAKMLCKIFYAEQFDALRRKCGAAERIIESLSRCLKWDSKGGKTKSVFLKTLDDRFVLKSLSPIETSAFIRFAPAYFGIMAEALFRDLPSVIAKMFGFYQVIIKNSETGTEIKLDLLLMENLFYDRLETRKFDLKGSMRNRKIQSTGEQNEVLLDENMVEYIYESPLFAREHSKKLLRASVWNDTLFFARLNVMDYSLMVAVDESRKELVVGIIDCIRTYTWDKKLESWIKDRGFAGGGRNKPTVTGPRDYKSRFREAMAR